MKLITRVEIAPMTAENIPAVLEIERRSFATPWPRDAYTHELDHNRTAVYLVARQDDVIVGYAGMWVVMDEAHITTIAVDPPLRGMGIGESLLIALVDRAIERRARWIQLEVRRSNVVAQNLYRKYGFRDVGVRRHYYSDNGEDAVVMWTGNVLEEFQERYRSLRAAFLGS
jgi:ribosomal-protein-alanine N-acetyltransferase